MGSEQKIRCVYYDIENDDAQCGLAVIRNRRASEKTHIEAERQEAIKSIL